MERTIVCITNSWAKVEAERYKEVVIEVNVRKKEQEEQMKSKSTMKELDEPVYHVREGSRVGERDLLPLNMPRRDKGADLAQILQMPTREPTGTKEQLGSLS